MESNYKVAYDYEWKRFKKRNFEEISKIRNVKYTKETNQIEMKIFNMEYILNCNDETIIRGYDNKRTGFETGIMILNYLSFTENEVYRSNKWISLKEIPNGGMMFYPAFYKGSIRRLIEVFGYDSYKLKACAMDLGAREIEMGDIAFEFMIFPKVFCAVVIWEGDDEIEPSATVLFDSSIQYIMHVESIIGLGGYIVDKIINEHNYIKP